PALLLPAPELPSLRARRPVRVDGRARGDLRALRRCGAGVQVRQPEARGAAVGGRAAGLQPALPRLRRPLRAARRGLSPPPPQRQARRRARVLALRAELPQRAQLPRPRRHARTARALARRSPRSVPPPDARALHARCLRRGGTLPVAPAGAPL